MNTDKNMFDCANGGINSSTVYARRATNIFELLCRSFMCVHSHRQIIALYVGDRDLFDIRVIVSCLVLWT